MSSSVKLLADREILWLDHCLPDGIEMTTFDPTTGLPVTAGSYDALLVRSITPVNAGSLGDETPLLSFVASATAGIDHVDTAYLGSRHIDFAHSAGCNAQAVAEYIITALLLWSESTNEALEENRIGIIGAGHTGGTVAQLLDNLGVDYRLYDPPKEEREDSFRGAQLDEVLECDILTFHTPLSRSGKYSTWHWLNDQKLDNRSFKLIINASRGGVVDEVALLKAHDSGRVGSYILDVWENEPVFSDEVAQKALYRTPHIAGYSRESKWQATLLVAIALADHFNLGEVNRELPAEIGSAETSIKSVSWSSTSGLLPLIHQLHPLLEYNRELTSLIGQNIQSKANGFQRIRAMHPLRSQFGSMQLPESVIESYPKLKALGFRNQ